VGAKEPTIYCTTKNPGCGTTKKKCPACQPAITHACAGRAFTHNFGRNGADLYGQKSAHFTTKKKITGKQLSEKFYLANMGKDTEQSKFSPQHLVKFMLNGSFRPSQLYYLTPIKVWRQGSRCMLRAKKQIAAFGRAEYKTEGSVHDLLI
jgi:hypothetical protein